MESDSSSSSEYRDLQMTLDSFFSFEDENKSGPNSPFELNPNVSDSKEDANGTTSSTSNGISSNSVQISKEVIRLDLSSDSEEDFPSKTSPNGSLSPTPPPSNYNVKKRKLTVSTLQNHKKNSTHKKQKKHKEKNSSLKNKTKEESPSVCCYDCRAEDTPLVIKNAKSFCASCLERRNTEGESLPVIELS
jgi:hypothetical protein